MTMTKEQKMQRGAELIRNEEGTDQNVTVNPAVAVGTEVTLADDCGWVEMSGVATQTIVVHTEGPEGMWVWIYDENHDDVYPVFADEIV